MQILMTIQRYCWRCWLLMIAGPASCPTPGQPRLAGRPLRQSVLPSKNSNWELFQLLFCFNVSSSKNSNWELQWTTMFSCRTLFSTWLRTTATWCTRTWPTSGNKVLHLPQVEQKIEKLREEKSFMKSFQKTGEGLGTRGARIKVALDLPGASSTPHLLWLTSTTFNFPTNQNNNILQFCKSY